MDIHKDILEKFDKFIEKATIPNIILYGPSGSGKKYMIHQLMKKIYHNDKDLMKNNIMYIDCSIGKGINFIREELKMFAKINMNPNCFKSIILLMIDKLTIDAQSALRRCIELYNNTTRFFAILENKLLLIKPLHSRFCDLYVSLPYIDGQYVNLHHYFSNNSNKQLLLKNKHRSFDLIENVFVKQIKEKPPEHISIPDCIRMSENLYQDGCSGLDLIAFLEEKMEIALSEKIKLDTYFTSLRQNMKSESMIMCFILYFGYIRRSSLIDYMMKL